MKIKTRIEGDQFDRSRSIEERGAERKPIFILTSGGFLGGYGTCLTPMVNCFLEQK
jgi:hypothetical protein